MPFVGQPYHENNSALSWSSYQIEFLKQVTVIVRIDKFSSFDLVHITS